MSVPRYWRESKYRYRLIGQMCASCGRTEFPRSGICGSCGSGNLKEVKLADTGTVVTWTVIRNPPKEYMEFAPYVVALLELDDGVRVLSQLVDVDPNKMKTGIRVEAAFRRIKVDGSSGIIEYGYKFRPIIE